MQEHNVSVPPHVVVSRDEQDNVLGEEFIEGEDFVQVGSKVHRSAATPNQQPSCPSFVYFTWS